MAPRQPALVTLATLLATLTTTVVIVVVVAVAQPGLAAAAGAAGQPAEDPDATTAASSCAITTPASSFRGQVDRSAAHARVWRLYQAYFLRQPDQTGFDYWLRIRGQGSSMSDIAHQFATGTEFTNTYGQLDDDAFVNLVYSNVLCRTPDSTGLAYWRNQLASGSLSRTDLVFYFVEGREYLRKTDTCHSINPEESAAVSGCPSAGLAPLAQASLADDGYRAFDRTVTRANNRGTGTFRAVEVDLDRGLLETGPDRCSVASINANWLVAAEKDRSNPGVLGVGVIDGSPAKNSSDRSDRGIVGMRFDSANSRAEDVIEVWPGDSVTSSSTRLSSVAHRNGDAIIESWHAAAELSPYLSELSPQSIVEAHQWVWAAAGIPLIIAGQTDQDLSSDISRDPYTYSTLRHSFLAIDGDTGRAVFGGTTNLDVLDLVVWAQGNGYEDLVKFDGGASAEYNINRSAVVAGTGRDIPVWLGIGC